MPTVCVLQLQRVLEESKEWADAEAAADRAPSPPASSSGSSRMPLSLVCFLLSRWFVRSFCRLSQIRVAALRAGGARLQDNKAATAQTAVHRWRRRQVALVIHRLTFSVAQERTTAASATEAVLSSVSTGKPKAPASSAACADKPKPKPKTEPKPLPSASQVQIAAGFCHISCRRLPLFLCQLEQSSMPLPLPTANASPSQSPMQPDTKRVLLSLRLLLTVAVASGSHSCQGTRCSSFPAC